MNESKKEKKQEVKKIKSIFNLIHQRDQTLGDSKEGTKMNQELVVRTFELGCSLLMAGGILLVCLVAASKFVYSQTEATPLVQDRIVNQRITNPSTYGILRTLRVLFGSEPQDIVTPSDLIDVRSVLGRASLPTEVSLPPKVKEDLAPVGVPPFDSLGVKEELAPVAGPPFDSLGVKEELAPVAGPPFDHLGPKELKPKTSEELETGSSLENNNEAMMEEHVGENALNLLDDEHNVQASLNGLAFELVPAQGVRFRYSGISEDRIGHVWYGQARDLRGKTLKIWCSGMLPDEITFELSRSTTSAKLVSHFRPERGRRTHIFSIDVPNTLPFRETSIFRVAIERSRQTRMYGEFLVEKVVIVENEGESWNTEKN